MDKDDFADLYEPEVTFNKKNMEILRPYKHNDFNVKLEFYQPPSYKFRREIHAGKNRKKKHVTDDEILGDGIKIDKRGPVVYDEESEESKDGKDLDS